jgi:polyphosphate kinase
MERNFFRRVEVAFSIVDGSLKARILADLDIGLSDNCQAWELRPDGRYELLTPEGNELPQSAQLVLLRQLSEGITLSAGTTPVPVASGGGARSAA